MSTALEEMVRRDRREMFDRRTVHTIMSILDSFIPVACRRDAIDAVHAAVDAGGYELTNRVERQQYEAWKATIVMPLDSDLLAIPEKPVADMTNAELATALRGKATPSPFLRNGPMAQMLEAAKRLEAMP